MSNVIAAVSVETIKAKIAEHEKTALEWHKLLSKKVESEYNFTLREIFESKNKELKIIIRSKIEYVTWQKYAEKAAALAELID